MESTEPRKRISQVISETIASQREEQAAENIDANADADPKFDARAGQSNFGKRVTAKIARALRENET